MAGVTLDEFLKPFSVALGRCEPAEEIEGINTQDSVQFIVARSQTPEQIVATFIEEAAKIDGANEFQIFSKVCIPICKGVITTCAILVFMDYWNMVEQPLLFFTDTDKYPLSIFLSKINAQEVGLAFAVATFYMIPSLLIFFYGEDQLVEGIAYQGGVKG